MSGISALKVTSVVHPMPSPGSAKMHGAVYVKNKRTRALQGGQTIKPEVKWQPEYRKPTNKGWGIAFKILYVSFIASCIFVLSQARPKYQRSADHSKKIISSQFRDEVSECCASIQEDGDVQLGSWGLCARPEIARTERRLKAGNSSFDGDEGLFDALLEAPEILCGIIPCIALLATLWVILMRRFSVKMIFGTEILKAAVLLVISFAAVRSAFVAFQAIAFLGICIVLFVIKKKEDLVKASRTISHSVAAFNSNPRMLLGLVGMKVVFLLHTSLFIATIVMAFDVVEVKKKIYELPAAATDDTGARLLSHGSDAFTGEGLVGSCVYDYPLYIRPVMQFQCVYWIWFIFVFEQIRLAVIGMIVGSDHFHPEKKCSVWQAIHNALTTSFGTLAFAGAIATLFDNFRQNRRTSGCGWWWLGPQACVILPLQLIMCAAGSCFMDALDLFTKFSVILHAFTGLSLESSAKQCKRTMQRHFVGGFITDYSARSVLFTTSYIFSVLIMLLTWVWMDKAFDCTSLQDTMKGGFWVVVIELLILVVVYTYPVLSIFIILRINTVLEDHNKSLYYAGQDTTQHQWIGPLAAVFAGCVSGIIFRFVRGIILDIVDTKFLCFAIDQDHGINREEVAENEEQSAFATLVKAMPDYVVACPVEDLDPEAPVVVGVIQSELPPVAEITIDEGGDGVGYDIEDGDNEAVGADGTFYEVQLDPEPDPEVRIAEVTFDEADGEQRGRKRCRFDFW